MNASAINGQWFMAQGQWSMAAPTRPSHREKGVLWIKNGFCGRVDEWEVVWISPTVSRVLGLLFPIGRLLSKSFFPKVMALVTVWFWCCFFMVLHDARVVFPCCCTVFVSFSDGDSHGFHMVFAWFSRGVPMVLNFEWFTFGRPLVLQGFSWFCTVLVWLSYGCAWFSYGFALFNHMHPH